MLGLLADSLLAGNCATFLGGDDFFSDVLEPVGEGAKLFVQLVVRREPLESSFGRGTSSLDAVDERAHRAEEGVHPHHRIKLLPAVRDRVGGAAIQPDLQLGLNYLRAL